MIKDNGLFSSPLKIFRKQSDTGNLTKMAQFLISKKCPVAYDHNSLKKLGIKTVENSFCFGFETFH